MQGVVDVKLIGLTELNASLGAMPAAVQDRLRPFIAQETLNLRNMVKSNIAQRFRSTGPLYHSVQSQVTEEPGRIEGRVFIDGADVPYAAIQEYGGTTSAHEIVPVRAKVLAFMGGGPMQFKGSSSSGMVFTRRVSHPGSRIPERSYAREALAYERVPFRDGIRAVVQSAIGETFAYKMAAE